MKKRMGKWLALAVALLLAAGLAGCFGKSGDYDADEGDAPDGRVTLEPARLNDQAGQPALPQSLTFVDGIPQLTVYNIATKSYDEMDIEDYVAGVLAGEMRNDWPMEALKAQAVLARTFVLKFIDEKESKYRGANISTDIAEAQAYDALKINDRIRKAIDETRGQIISSDGKLPYAWFHAHAGGTTELPSAALEYKQADPAYTQVTESPDSDKAPTDVKNWTATFTADEVLKAVKASGVPIDKLTSINIGVKGESGRAKTLLINGREVSAPALRINLDSAKLKSTLLSDVKLENGKVTFSGKGYGHGVGMSQWGAYGMADEGKDYKEIIAHYFKDVGIATLWE